jgi:hypothetical protein
MSTVALQTRFPSQSMFELYNRNQRVYRHLEQQLRAAQEEIRQLKATIAAQERMSSPSQEDVPRPPGINPLTLCALKRRRFC